MGREVGTVTGREEGREGGVEGEGWREKEEREEGREDRRRVGREIAERRPRFCGGAKPTYMQHASKNIQVMTDFFLSCACADTSAGALRSVFFCSCFRGGA